MRRACGVVENEVAVISKERIDTRHGTTTTRKAKKVNRHGTTRTRKAKKVNQLGTIQTTKWLVAICARITGAARLEYQMSLMCRLEDCRQDRSHGPGYWSYRERILVELLHSCHWQHTSFCWTREHKRFELVLAYNIDISFQHSCIARRDGVLGSELRLDIGT